MKTLQVILLHQAAEKLYVFEFIFPALATHGTSGNVTVAGGHFVMTTIYCAAL